MSNLFSCLWFNEVDRFTSRDQLSFAYTYLKLRRMNPERPFQLYMFKVNFYTTFHTQSLSSLPYKVRVISMTIYKKCLLHKTF